MPAPPSLPPLPLVGRSPELAWITAALDAAPGAAPALLLVAGEGGVGKTRLAAAAGAEAARRGWAVAEGRAYAVETGVPYAVFADALLPVLRRLDGAALSALTRGGGGELARVFPTLFPGADGAAEAGAGAAEAKARLFWSVSQLLGRLAARRPLLLVLENLQWADAASTELLHFAARQAHAQARAGAPGAALGNGARGGEAGRLLVLGTYNEAEREQNPLLRPAEQSLAALGAASVARLAPLGAADTHELVRRVFGADAGAVRDFARLLHEWTRGNPFFVEETLKSLVAAGRLAEQDGRWQGWDVDALALPRTVRDAVLERVARAGEGAAGDGARRVLDVAAVLGGRVAHAELAAAAGLPESALAAALDALGRARLLVDAAADAAADAGADGGDAALDAAPHASPDAPDAYDFAHPLVREVVYAALGRARARALHAEVAVALERLYGDAGAAAHAGALAHHLTRAGAGAGPRAARYLEAAGRQALAAHADRAAAGYLQAALDLRDGGGPDGGPANGESPGGGASIAGVPDGGTPGASGGADDDAAAAVVAPLARARQRLGEHAAATALWARLRVRAEAHGDARGLAAAERQLGLVAAAAGRHAEALARHDAGLAAALAAGDGPLATRLRLARAAALQSLGRHDDALAEGRRALVGAEAAAAAGAPGSQTLLARAHRALLLLHIWTGPAERAHAHGAQAVALAEAAGEPGLAWSAHWATAILGGLTGDAAATARHVAASERLADAVGSPVLRIWTAEVAVEYMAGVGDWGAALALADRTTAAARALGQRTLLPRLLVWAGLVHRGRGDLERSRGLVEEAWALTAEAPDDVHARIPAHTGMAGYLVTAGEPARALQVGEVGLALADAGGYVAWAVYRLLPFVIEAALYVQDWERAARHAARLRRDAGRLGHVLGMAWADTADALLAHLTGPPGGAAARLCDAAAALEAVPFVFDAARLRRTAARALRDAGDRAGAERELRRAHAVFARLGAEREVRGTREQLRELGARPPARAGAAGAGGLSGREAEIARLVALRKSNKEIAAALDISPRTVSTHLSHIFEKTGVGSRGELTDLVRGAGLAG